LSKPVLPVAVTIGGNSAKVTYAGGAPNLVDGVLQVNVDVPAGLSIRRCMDRAGNWWNR
jgi:uncharacterized protein (TIGR03437 family)